MNSCSTEVLDSILLVEDMGSALTGVWIVLVTVTKPDQ